VEKLIDESIFYLNGDFIKKDKTLVNILDLGIVRGYGIFEFLITYQRKPFRLNDHIKRLFRSARIIGLSLPWSEKKLSELVNLTLDKNPKGEKSIRIIVTGGESENLITPSSNPTLAIIVLPHKRYPLEYYEKGGKIITYKFNRESPEAKTLNYIFGVRASMEAKKLGATEVLYTCGNYIYECVSSNFFSIKNGTIITTGENILNGITRKVVLELIKDKYNIIFKPLRVSELDSIDEAFLTSSNREVMPITMIDKIVIGNGTPGPITKNIMASFTNYTKQYSMR
jgi:branched-chain amino acid aminotransferase